MPNLPRIKSKRAATVTAAACALVAGYEGLSLTSYPDSVNVATICYGETRGVKMGDAATKAECDAMLLAAMHEYGAAVDACAPKLPDPSYIAFTSAAYNIGIRAFCTSSMARKANAGDLAGACDALSLWNKVTLAGVKVSLPGLTRRRQEERALCLEGLQ